MSLPPCFLIHEDLECRCCWWIVSDLNQSEKNKDHPFPVEKDRSYSFDESTYEAKEIPIQENAEKD